jgi:ABC-2 type transport system permease protein
MKHYWSVYKEFFRTSFSENASFRLSFILIILVDIFFYTTTIMGGDFIYNHISQIGLWDRHHLLFFLSFMLVVETLHMSLVSENFWEMSHQIQSGEFDFILLRPINSLFTTFFRRIRTPTIFNFILSFYFLFKYGLACQLTLLDWILVLPLVGLSFLLRILLEFSLACFTFWMVDGMALNFLRMQMQQFSRWPNFIYKMQVRMFFTWGIPVLMIGSAPIHFLFNHEKWKLLLFMIFFCAVWCLILRALWNKALSSYNSASS